MSAQAQFYLPLILFLPWFAILGALYWLFPREPRTPARRWFDVAVLVASTIASWIGMRWGFAAATANAGPIWKQVLASLLTYAGFLGILTLAAIARARLFRAR
ncbi:MAG: hypothetical protein ACREPX_00275 [Rhodanobacteraceae bacterium]